MILDLNLIVFYVMLPFSFLQPDSGKTKSKGKSQNSRNNDDDNIDKVYGKFQGIDLMKHVQHNEPFLSPCRFLSLDPRQQVQMMISIQVMMTVISQ